MVGCIVHLSFHVFIDKWKLTISEIHSKPTDLDVRKQEFEKYFPELAQKIRFSSKPATEVYNWAKENFDNLVKSLGSDFKTIVQKYESGLRHFQSQHVSRGWKPMYYRDGQSEYC